MFRISENQTFQDFKCVIGNDGSTDKTQEIVEKFHPNTKIHKIQSFKFKIFTSTRCKSGRTFNKGLETENIEEFDVVCKFDADIIFPKNYLEKKINEVYKKKSKAGMVSVGLYLFLDKPVSLTKKTFLQLHNFFHQSKMNGFSKICLLKITFVHSDKILPKSFSRK